MGQQQLLLLVLGIVIVGLAVVVGIQSVADNQKKANLDALSMTSVRLATDAQSWLRNPIALGGGMPTVGARPIDYTGLTLDFDIMGYPVNGSNEYADMHGSYLGEVSGANFVIRATSSNTSGAGDNNLVCIVVKGSAVADVQMDINPSSGSCS